MEGIWFIFDWMRFQMYALNREGFFSMLTYQLKPFDYKVANRNWEMWSIGFIVFCLQGRYSETDAESWTPDLLKALNYDRLNAVQNDNGMCLFLQLL